MKRKKERIGVRSKKGAAAAILCGLLLCGCGRADAAADVTASPAKEGETLETQGTSSGEESVWEDQGTSSGEESVWEDQGTSPEEDSAPEAQGIPSEEASVPEESAADAGQTVTWEAMIESVSVDSFTVSEIFTTELDDGSMLAVAPIGDTERKMIEVTYTDQTVFTIRSTYENGLRHSDSEGTSADLQELASCILSGSWEGEVFCASEVVIYNHCS